MIVIEKLATVLPKQWKGIQVALYPSNVASLVPWPAALRSSVGIPLGTDEDLWLYQAIHIKTHDSIALPIYHSLPVQNPSDSCPAPGHPSLFLPHFSQHRDAHAHGSDAPAPSPFLLLSTLRASSASIHRH